MSRIEKHMHLILNGNAGFNGILQGRQRFARPLPQGTQPLSPLLRLDNVPIGAILRVLLTPTALNTKRSTFSALQLVV
jgi:hypothetical protein